MDSAQSPQVSSLHFLVAIHDPAESAALAAALRRLGAITITEVPDGHMALRWLQETGANQVDIALVDMALAGIDALALMHTLAAQRAAVRLVVLGGQTANVMLSVETLAQAYGVELPGTIVKPASDAKLAALLANDVAPGAPPVPAPAPATVFGLPEVGAALKARQFEPFFQPKIALASGQAMGLEVFARWRHPVLGVLGPEYFMAAFEQNGRIGFLDWTMIEQAVAHCRQFHAQGRPLTLSINIDPGTLSHPGFIAQITACMQRHAMLPDYLTFELPESSVLVRNPGFIERLLRLRMLGFRLAIDDYGTGMPSVQLLAQVPFSELKIDRRFVDGASRLALARRLGLFAEAGVHLCAVVVYRQPHARRGSSGMGGGVGAVFLVRRPFPGNETAQTTSPGTTEWLPPSPGQSNGRSPAPPAGGR